MSRKKASSSRRFKEENESELYDLPSCSVVLSRVDMAKSEQKESVCKEDNSKYNLSEDSDIIERSELYNLRSCSVVLSRVDMAKSEQRESSCKEDNSKYDLSEDSDIIERFFADLKSSNGIQKKENSEDSFLGSKEKSGKRTLHYSEPLRKSSRATKKSVNLSEDGLYEKMLTEVITHNCKLDQKNRRKKIKIPKRFSDKEAWLEDSPEKPKSIGNMIRQMNKESTLSDYEKSLQKIREDKIAFLLISRSSVNLLELHELLSQINLVMWRYKPSKYKNAVPKIPKKGEGWITDISVGSLPSFGNHIKASATSMAFNIDSAGGGNLGVLSLNETGSKSRNLSVLHAHSEFVTDMDFCPYDDEILATGSQDQHVKLWRITENSLNSNIPCNPEVDILTSNKVEVVKFHPQADCILSVVEDSNIHLWDINTKQSIFVDTSHQDTVQSISWRLSGEVLASCGKDKKLRLWDPRDSSKNQVAASHSNNRDSRVVWLGDTEQLLSTGFGSGREREVLLRDIRKLEDPVASYSGDSSLGVYIPLFDPDTNMLFLVAKADTAISFWEVLDHAPFLQEATKYLGEVQAKGAALVPKRALEVMDGEVNRLLLLGQNCIVPISYQVPRKSYRDFHADLFPDTLAPEPSLTSSHWQAGEKAKGMKISLMPSKTGASLVKRNHHLGYGPKKESLNLSAQDTVSNETAEKLSSHDDDLQTEKFDNSKKLPVKPQPARKPSPPIKPKPANIETKLNKPASPVLTPKYVDTVKQSFNKENGSESSKKNPSPAVRRSARTFGIRVSKFRHLDGNVFPKECHITDLPALTRTIPGESNCFDANEKRVAVPIGAAGNFLAVLELSKAGRAAAAADMPGVLTTASVMDFAWDPFNSCRLAVVCDTGDVQIWNIPEDGLDQKLEEPFLSFKAHSEKASIVKFHPCTKDIIATASGDLSIRIWDLCSQEEKFFLSGHTDQILNFAWSPDGQFLASVCKDQKIRLFEPRKSSDAVKEGPGPQGTRGARIVWVLNATCLAVTGFSKVSERQIYLYDCKDLSNPMGDIGLDVSPATLIPYYDEDSSTLFLSGKGDSVIFAYEIATDSPYFHPLSHYKCNTPHQSLSFLPKCICNVQEVEFSRAIRLTAATIEPISFHVPRLRSEYFQDDLFPPTHITWKPSMTSVEWLSGLNKSVEMLSLQPAEMIPLSQAPPLVKASSNKPPPSTSPRIAFEGEVVLQSSLAFLQNSKEKEEKIVQSMSSQCELQQTSLPQEAFEGVDPVEWDEEEKQHSQQNL